VSAAVTEDNEIIGEIVKWAREEGKPPGQNRVVERFGIGKTRAVRLLASADQELAADRTKGGRKRSDRTGPKALTSGPTGPVNGSDRTTESDRPGGPDQPPSDQPVGPDRTGAEQDRPGNGTGPDLPAGNGQKRSDTTLDRTAVPDRTDTPDRTATGPQPDHRTGTERTTQPDRSAGPDRTVLTKVPDHQLGPVQLPNRTARTDQPDRSDITTAPGRRWPILLLALPAFIAIWSGWVGLGGLTGFGVVHPLPGIWDGAQLNTAITLPIGVETYAAFALRVWLSGTVPTRARRFAKWSAIGSLVLGGLGQVAYHLMVAAKVTSAPWQITTLVACIPVAVLGMGAALAHLSHGRRDV